MSIERDRCAVEALRLAVRLLGVPLSVVDKSGNVALTQRGQDIEYIRMTLDLYDDVLAGMDMRKVEKVKAKD